jgi:DNA-binding NarL/FixJ family response regulator
MGMPQFDGLLADVSWVTGVAPPEPKTASLRVLLVNHHLMMLEGLMAAVEDEPDIEIVGAATSAANTLVLATKEQPDVIVLGLESELAIETATRLRNHLNEAAIVVIATSPDESLQLRAVDAGCSAVVTTGGSITELVVAIRAAANGDSMFPGKVLRLFLRRSRERTAHSELTERELEILSLLGEGESTRSITDRLTLSPHTVRNHIKNLMAKLSAHSRLEAVMKAQTMGLIERTPEYSRTAR